MPDTMLIKLLFFSNVQAFKEGIYGRRYQWIITGIYEDNWWQLTDDESEMLGCNEEQLLTAIDGCISTDVLPLSKNTNTHYGFVSVTSYNHIFINLDICIYTYIQSKNIL